jgi:hypothetical protein
MIETRACKQNSTGMACFAGIIGDQMICRHRKRIDARTSGMAFGTIAGCSFEYPANMTLDTFQIQVGTGEGIPRLRMAEILHIGVFCQRMH